MRKFIDLVEASIEEAGAGPARIAHHIRNGEMFIMLSAMRADLDHKTNLRRTKELKQRLSGAPVSFIDTFGEYHEVGQDEPSPESSFFIMPRKAKGGTISPDAFLNLGEAIMRAYDQDAIIFGDGTDIRLVERDGTSFTIGNATTFDPTVIKTLPGFSKIKKRPFAFTDTDLPRAAKYASDKPLTKTSSMR